MGAHKGFLAIFAVATAFLLLFGCSGKQLPLKFEVPKELPAGKVNIPYSYTFCKPQPANENASCIGPGNPSGGVPPYMLRLSLNGFPPVGTWMSLNGLLSGTPRAPGIYTFEVCAKDNATSEKCGTTKLTILASTPPPPKPEIECEKDEDCATGICGSGKCIQCTKDADCPNWGQCRLGTCFKKVVCMSDSDCPVGRCSEGMCRGCKSDSQCAGGYCDTQGYCRELPAAECEIPSDCYTGFCKNNKCANCENKSDCDVAEFCSEWGACEPVHPCTKDSDCWANICDKRDGKCTVCVNDSDCGAGRRCDDFACKSNSTSAYGVTVSPGTCEITQEYTGDTRGVLRSMGAKYARMYSIKASGTMSGPVGAKTWFSTKPIVSGPSSEFDCGGWYKDTSRNQCVRTDEYMANSANWYYITDAYGEQVNADADMRVTFWAEVTDSTATTKDKKYASIACQKVDY